MTSEDKRQYHVCAICHRPTEEGREHCKYCWSRLPQDREVSSAEAREILASVEAKAKRKKISRRWYFSVGSVVLAVVITLVSLAHYTDVFSKPDPTVNSSSKMGQWGMYRHDLQHSASIGTNDVLPQGNVLWTFDTGGFIQSSPAVVNGIVYFGSRDGKVYAVDALTGEKKWDFQTGSFVLASPVVADGVVYIGSNDGYLYALNALTGKKVWSFYTKYAVMSASAVAGGVIYFGADDSKFHALDVTTGKEIWSSTTGSQIRGSAVVTNGIVYFGSDDGNLYALGARDGKFRLHFLSAPVLGSPAAVGTTIWFTNQTGYLFSIDGMARNWPWEYDIKPLWLQAWAMHIAPQPPRLSGLLTGVRLGSKSESSPSIKDNSLFVGIDFNLVGYDIKNETTLWTFKTGGNVYSSPATAGGVVYVGSEDGNIYAVDATTGKELWHVQTGDKIVSSPALANGVLYIGSFDGKLYAIK